MANTPYTTTAPVGVGRFEYLQFQYNLADIAAGDILVDFVVPFPFKLIGVTASSVTSFVEGIVNLAIVLQSLEA